jgi:hypothetical protein
MPSWFLREISMTHELDSPCYASTPAKLNTAFGVACH